MEIKEALIDTIAQFSSGEMSEDSRREDLEREDSRQEDSRRGDLRRADSPNILIDIKEESEGAKSANPLDDEMALLLRLKEKSLVLFEGLKRSPIQSLEAKLEITIGYLEYQLYTIDDRLKTLEEQGKKDARTARRGG